MKTPSISEVIGKEGKKMDISVRRVTFFLLILLLCLSSSLHADESVRVVSVGDGDTIKVEYGGKRERVRLIGIDAPESRPNTRANKQSDRSGKDMDTILAMGKQATAFVKTLVKPGDQVRLESDVEKRDRYGRVLAYVYLKDGRMLNEEIVKAGYANLLTKPPNAKYQERFLRAYKEARENKRGLWKQ